MDDAIPQRIVEWEDFQRLQEGPTGRSLPQPSSKQYASVYKTVKPKVNCRRQGSYGKRGSRTNGRRAEVERIKERPPWDPFLRSISSQRPPRLVSKPDKEEMLKRRQWRLDREKAQEERYKVKAKNDEMRRTANMEAKSRAWAQRRNDVQERYLKKIEKWEKAARDRQQANLDFLNLKRSVRKQKLLHERLHEEFEQSASDAESEKQLMYSKGIHRMRVLRPCDIIATNALEQLQREIGNVYNYSMQIQNDPERRPSSRPRKMSAVSRRSSPCERARPQALGRLEMVDRAVSPVDWDAVEETPKEEHQLRKLLDVRRDENARLIENAQEVNIEEDMAQGKNMETPSFAG